MTCKHVQRRLAEDLPDSPPPRLAAHLAECEACRAAWQRLRAGVAALDALSIPPAPPALRGRVLAAIEATPRRSLRLAPAWAAAAMAVVVVSLAVTHRPPEPRVAAGDLHAGGMVGQHAAVLAADPLADATALHAVSALSVRAELGEQ
jgi:predicted anti-sigma-YlaC factor YlaD